MLENKSYWQRYLEYRKETIDIESKYYKPNNDFAPFEIFLVLIAFVPFLYELVESSFSFFFHNYIFYSLSFMVVLIMIGFYLARIFHSRNFFTYFFLIPLMSLTWSIWFIPKLIHYTYAAKTYLCVEANLTRKFYTHKDSLGDIWFDINYTNDMPREFMYLDSLNAIETVK